MTSALTTPDAASGSHPQRNRRASRLWQRLLSAGAGDLAELRGWDRLIAWEGYTTPGERRHAVKRFLKLPARAAREAYADVGKFGREVAEQAGVPRRRQFLQLWWLKVRHGMDAQAYIDYQLYRPERWRRAGDYLGEKEFSRVGQFIKLQKGGGQGRVLWDKRLFDAWCREHGFPTVPTLLELEDGRVTYSASADGALPACDLFSKPVDGTGGQGTGRWIYDGHGGYVGRDGRTRGAAELLEELATVSRNLGKRGTSLKRLLVQQCLYNHHALAPLTPGALSTIRLQTYRWPQGEAELLFAACRMPVGDAPADNFHHGGIVASVDLATGRLGPAIYRRGKLITTVDRHVTTGNPIAGHQLPFWGEVVRLALRAHDAVPRLSAVGWDVAVLEDGPILVEGNTLPNPDIAQAPTGVPLGATPFVRCLNAHLRECFDV